MINIVPTAAHHDPSTDAAAIRARANEVDDNPDTATTDPRFNPLSANNGSSAGSTGNTR